MKGKVFLAGAAGAIGRRLGPLLVDADYEVFGTTRSAAKAAELESAGVKPDHYRCLRRTGVVSSDGDSAAGHHHAPAYGSGARPRSKTDG